MQTASDDVDLDEGSKRNVLDVFLGVETEMGRRASRLYPFSVLPCPVRSDGKLPLQANKSSAIDSELGIQALSARGNSAYEKSGANKRDEQGSLHCPGRGKCEGVEHSGCGESRFGPSSSASSKLWPSAGVAGNWPPQLRVHRLPLLPILVTRCHGRTTWAESPLRHRQKRGKLI